MSAASRSIAMADTLRTSGRSIRERPEQGSCPNLEVLPNRLNPAMAISLGGMSDENSQLHQEASRVVSSLDRLTTTSRPLLG
jgi:hypothetical protein